MDLVHGQLARDLRHGRVAQCRRGHDGGTGDLARGLTAGMEQLHEHFGTVSVDAVGELFVGCDLRIFPETADGQEAAAGLLHGKVLRDDQAEAAAGFVLVVGHELFGGPAFRIAVVHHHGGDHQAVFDLRMMDGNGIKNHVLMFPFWIVSEKYAGYAEQPAYSLPGLTGVPDGPQLHLEDVVGSAAAVEALFELAFAAEILEHHLLADPAAVVGLDVGVVIVRTADELAAVDGVVQIVLQCPVRFRGLLVDDVDPVVMAVVAGGHAVGEDALDDFDHVVAAQCRQTVDGSGREYFDADV